MKKKIAEYEVGEQVDIFLLIKTATKGIASNGKPFLTVILQIQVEILKQNCGTYHQKLRNNM